MDVIDLGCGKAKTHGAVGVDLRPFPGVDLVADLGSAGLPIASDSFDLAVMHDILEHVPDVVRVMEEVHRILRPGGRAEIRVPFFAGRTLFDDPTHVRGFSHRSFDFFCPGTPCYSKGYSRCAFRIERVQYEADHQRRFALDRAIVGLCNRWKDVYERRFAFMYPVGSVHFTLVAEKGPGDGMRAQLR